MRLYLAAFSIAAALAATSAVLAADVAERRAYVEPRYEEEEVRVRSRAYVEIEEPAEELVIVRRPAPVLIRRRFVEELPAPRWAETPRFYRRHMLRPYRPYGPRRWARRGW